MTTTKKKTAKWVSLILSVMMVFAFMPFLGTQEAYALEIKDTITIDMSQGPQTFEDYEQCKAIEKFLLDMRDEVIQIKVAVTVSGDKEFWYLDFDNDSTDDAIMTINKDPYKITLEETPEHSLHDANLQQSSERLAYYEDISDISYSFDGLAYYYRGIHFVMTEMVQIRDNLNIDLYNGVQTFNGLEGYTIDYFLSYLANNGFISQVAETHDSQTFTIKTWYDLDKNGGADIYTWEDQHSPVLGDYVIKIEKTDTCSVAKTAAVAAPDEFAEVWASLPVGSSEAMPFEYMYKKITFNMAKAVTPTVILSKKSFTYNGKTQKPAVTVKVGSKTLTGADYTVVNKGRKDAGKGTVKVTLKGNYYGGKTVTYTINKAKNPLAVTGKTATVMYSKVKNAAQKLALYKVIKTSKKGKGTVTYTKKSGNGKITIAKKTGKVTVKKGIKKGTYTVKVNVRAAGTKNYKALTRTVTFKIKVK